MPGFFVRNRLADVSDVLLAESMVTADVIDKLYIVLDGDISDSANYIHTLYIKILSLKEIIIVL